MLSLDERMPCDPRLVKASDVCRGGGSEKSSTTTMSSHGKVRTGDGVAPATRCGCRTGESPVVCRTMSCSEGLSETAISIDNCEYPWFEAVSAFQRGERWI